ncbi:cell wall integrity and stress response component 2-like isoform X2 [Pomacea canaliculata]|uniref:cell wall integrity and stress response component 2-like isoform X2 n=1 Tax=Pomacea canaliculata TaxID=400727 RepID=UPI000D731751|nr:cell wall integrity and stress response component 2-like isoform X2 [Pomacea canaliculata]
MSFLEIICVAVIYWSLFLSGCVTNGDSEICYGGYTGPESGGSCTFSSSGLCNYRGTNDGAQWEVTNNTEAFVDMYGRNKGHRAVLTSPWMCGDNITTICIQFNFMFDCRDGCRLTLKLCHVTTGCHVVWFADSGDKDEWHQARLNIALTNRGQFQIQFEGEKTYDRWIHTETNFYLDNIVYNNASCFTDSASAPPPTSDDLLSTSEQSTIPQRTTAMLEGSSFETSNTIDYFKSTTTINPSQPLSTVLKRRMITASQPWTTSAKASITPDTPDTSATTTPSTTTTATTTTTTTTTSSPTTTTTTFPTTTKTTTTSPTTTMTTSPTTTKTTTSTTPAASSATTLSTPATTSLSETSMTTIMTTKEMTEKGRLFSTFTPAEEGEVSKLTKVSHQNEGLMSETEGTSTMTTSLVTDLSSVTSLSLDKGPPSLPTGSDVLYTDESSGTGDALDKTTRNLINDKDYADHSSRNNNSVIVNQDRIDNVGDSIADNGNDEEKSGAHNAQATESGASSTSYLPLIVGVTLGLAVGMAVMSVLAWMWARNRRKHYELPVEKYQMNIIGSIEGNRTSND